MSRVPEPTSCDSAAWPAQRPAGARARRTGRPPCATGTARSRWRRAEAATWRKATERIPGAPRRDQAGRGDGGDPAGQARAAGGEAADAGRAHARHHGRARRWPARRSARPGRARSAARRRSAWSSLAPALMALRGGDLAAYHGVEHKSIAAYEQDGEAADAEQGARPLRLQPGRADAGAAALGNVAARRAGCAGRPPRPRWRSAAQPWRSRCSPGRSATTARAGARAAQARLRDPARGRHARAHRGAARGRARRRWPRSCGWRARAARRQMRRRPSAPGSTRRLPAAGRADPRGLLLGRLLQPDQGAAGGRGPPPARDHAGVPEAGRGAGRDRRGDRLLKQCSGRRDGRTAGCRAGSELEVHALHEGDEIEPWETVHDHRGRLLACSPTWRPSTWARWRAARWS